MYCTNCGARINDNSKFCTQCGARIGQLSQETPVEASGSSQKKHGKLKLAVIIVAILIIASCGVMAKDSIIRTVSPKTYLAMVFNNTISKISDELSKSKKALMGISLSDKDSFTVGLAAELDSFSTDNYYYQDLSNLKGIGASINLSVDKSGKQLLGQSQVVLKDNPILGINLFLNDDEVGVNIPELFDQYWTAKTANFGKQWNDSFYGSHVAYMSLSEDLDLSFSKLMDYSKQGITEETRKKIAETTKEFVKHMQLGDITSTSVTLQGNSVKAREIPVIIQGSELESYLVDLMEIFVEDDQVINQILTLGYYDDFIEGYEMFLEAFKEYVNIRGDITINVVEYKGIIVGVELEKELEVYNQEAELTLEINSRDNGNLTNDFNIDIGLEIEGEKLTIELSSKGNHVPQKDSFTDNTRLVIRIPYEEDLVLENECDIDMKKGTIDGSYEFRVDEGNIKIDYSGEYSNSKELRVLLDDVDITVNDYGESSKISGSIGFTLSKGAKKDLIKIGEKQYILDMDEDQLSEYFEDEDIHDRTSELAESFYMAIGLY